MTPQRDDALSWDGDDDPTLDAGTNSPSSRAGEAAPSSPPGASALPEGYTAVGRGSDPVDDASAAVVVDPAPAATRDDAGDLRPMSNATLITIGVLGGAYALYTVGWIIGGLRLQGLAQYLVTDAMFVGSFVLAALAPAAWFGTTYLLTRRTGSWLRIVWLVAGLVLLVPWPFVMIGTVGQ